MERMNQKVGIVGLGLIGASLAKALSHRTDCTVYGLDIDRSTVEMALAEGTIAAELTDLEQLDVLIVALFPQTTVEYIQENVEKLRKGCLVMTSAASKSRWQIRWLRCAKAAG